MQQANVDPSKLRRKVEADFLVYAASYEAPEPGETIGQPWDKARVNVEVEAMFPLLVDPYPVEYESGDDLLPPEQRLIGVRSAFVVAEDAPYFLLFDHEAEDFVLACKGANGRLAAWGVRGDATSTFLAR